MKKILPGAPAKSMASTWNSTKSDIDYNNMNFPTSNFIFLRTLKNEENATVNNFYIILLLFLLKLTSVPANYDSLSCNYSTVP